MKPSFSRAWKPLALLSICASVLVFSGCGGGGGGSSSGGGGNGGGSLSNPTARLTGEYNVNNGEEIGTFALAFVNNGPIRMQIASPNVLGLLTLDGTVNGSGAFSGAGSVDFASSGAARALNSTAPRILKPTPGKASTQTRRATKALNSKTLSATRFPAALVSYSFSGQLSSGAPRTASGTFTFGTGADTVSGAFEGTQIPSSSAFIGSFNGSFFANDSDETGELQLSIASDGITTLRATASGATGSGPGVFDFSSGRLTNTVRFQVGTETAFASYSGLLNNQNGVRGSGEFFAEGGDTGGWTIGAQ